MENEEALTTTKTTISIIDDSLLTRISLRQGLLIYNHKVISDFTEAEDFINSIKAKTPEVVLIKLNLKSMNGIEATQKIKVLSPEIKVIIMAPSMQKEFFNASMFFGASAFVPKDIEISKLAKIISAVKIGAYWFEPKLINNYKFSFPKPDSFDLLRLYNKENRYDLTKREKEVLKLVVEGKTNLEIAKEMIVSINTAKAHVGSILAKLKVSDRVQAAVKAVQAKLV